MDAVIAQINSAGKTFIDFAWPMLWQSSALIAILSAVDFLLRKRVRAVFRYWLWMLLVIKLILPTTLSSPVSIGRFVGEPMAAINVTAAEQPVGGKISNVQNALPTVTGQADSPQASPIQRQAVAPATITWQGGIFLIWLMAVCAMILLLLQRAVFVCGLVRQSAEVNGVMNDTLRFCSKLMGVRQTIGLKVSPNATSPAVCGLFRPVILLPQGLGSSVGIGSVRMVLMHELAHIKRGDLWVNLVQTLLQIAYFYNPLLWLANVVIRRVREQAVDEAVQVALGEKAPQYPETLLNVAKLAFERPALSLRLVGVVESKSALTSRIKRMLTRPIPKTAKLGIIGSVVVILLAAILLPMAKAAPPPEFVIKGTVTDAQTGKPIAGAKVGDEKYSGGTQFTYTDENGNYSYKTWSEEHTISVQVDGYQKQIKGFHTRLFPLDLFENKKVIDFSVISQNSADSIEFKAALQNVAFQVSARRFAPGDYIEITNITGTSDTLKPGGRYTVKGNYKLSSRDEASLHLYTTNGETKCEQNGNVTRGQGQFERTFDYLKQGWLHLSFYPAKGGNSFGGIYFDNKGADTKIPQFIFQDADTVSPAKDEDAGDNYSDITVQEGVGFDGFIVGDPNCTREFIKSKLGEPDEENDWGQQGLRIVYHKQYGLDFWLNLMKKPDLQENTLYEIRLNKGFKGKLASGISMSSTKQDVFKIYGEPFFKQTVENVNGNFTDRVLFKSKDGIAKIYYNDNGVLFWFMEDKINQIVVYQQHITKDKTNSIRVYRVNRSVNEFDQKEDFSTPETAYAAINQISAGEDSNGWLRVSAKELADKLAGESERGKNKVEPEWAEVLLNAKILEARICDGNNAIIIAQLPQEFSSQPIKKPIDVRHLKFEDGKWLNTGNDRVWTIEEARAQFDNLCNQDSQAANKVNEAKKP